MNTTNTNFSNCVNSLKANVKFDINQIDLSQKPSRKNLLIALSKKYKIQASQVELFSSKNAAIFSLFELFNLNYCTVYSPTLIVYKKYAKNNNYIFDNINKMTNITRAVEENSLVVFENPSCIDGKYIEIEEYIKAWDKLNCTIIIDESYLDFTNYQSATKLLNKYNNLYIIKSLGTYYGIDAIQTSMLVTSTENIHKIKMHEAKHKISALDIKYLELCLKDEVFEKTTNAINIKNYLLLFDILEKSQYFEKVYESDTNLILVKVKKEELEKFLALLKKEFIEVHSCKSYELLDEYYFRFTILDEKSILRLKEVL